MKENEAIDVLNMIEEHGPLPTEAKKMAIKALEEVQQYQALEKRLSDMFGGSLSLKMCVDELERILTEPDSPHPMNAKILTYQEAADWEAYRAIGTPEECLEAVEKQTDEKPTAVLGTFGGKEYECKNCGSDVCYGDEYCRWCGQKLDWSDEE